MFMASKNVTGGVQELFETEDIITVVITTLLWLTVAFVVLRLTRRKVTVEGVDGSTRTIKEKHLVCITPSTQSGGGTPEIESSIKSSFGVGDLQVQVKGVISVTAETLVYASSKETTYSHSDIRDHDSSMYVMLVTFLDSPNTVVQVPVDADGYIDKYIQYKEWVIHFTEYLDDSETVIFIPYLSRY